MLRKPQSRPRAEQSRPSDQVAEWAELTREWEATSKEYHCARNEDPSSPETASAHARLVSLKARMDVLVDDSRKRRQPISDSIVVATLLSDRSGDND